MLDRVGLQLSPSNHGRYFPPACSSRRPKDTRHDQEGYLYLQEGLGPHAARNLVDLGRARRVSLFTVAARISRMACKSHLGRPCGRSAAYSWRGRWDTVGLLLHRANHNEHGNHLVTVPVGVGIRLNPSRIGTSTAEWTGWGGAAVVLRAGVNLCTWRRAAAISRRDGRCNAGRCAAGWWRSACGSLVEQTRRCGKPG